MGLNWLLDLTFPFRWFWGQRGSGLCWEHSDLRAEANLLQACSLCWPDSLLPSALKLQLMSSCWDNIAKELSTALAQQSPDQASYTGSSRGPQACTLEEQSAMLLCRMWRMKGMLGAIMDPDNILHLRAWLQVSGFSPSMDAIGKKNKKKNDVPERPDQVSISVHKHHCCCVLL